MESNFSGKILERSPYVPFYFMGHFNSPNDMEGLTRLCFQASTRRPSPNYLEIGSYTGLSATVAARYFTKVYCVDKWDGATTPGEVSGNGNHYQAFVKNMAGLVPDIVVPLVGTSEFWAQNWHNRDENHVDATIDMLFIDGMHDYKSVYDDIINWMGSVRVGGTIAGHDFCPQFPEVEKAVRDIFPGEVNLIGDSIWWVIKKRPVESIKSRPLNSVEK